MRNRTSITLAAALLALAASAAPLHAAPPGWELRNGSWVPVIQPAPDTPEGQVAAFLRDFSAGKYKDVVHNAKQWLKANKTNPLVPQVLLLHGDAELARGNKYEALFPYEDLLNNFPTSELYVPTLQREYDIADSFLKGYKQKLPILGWRILPVTDEAITLLDRLQDRLRTSPLAERAGLRIADHYYAKGQFLEAVDAYSDFLRRYPFSQFARKAEIRRAEASLGSFRGPKFDITPLLDGRQRITAIQDTYPQTAENLQVKALQDRVYQMEGRKELEIARYYWRAGKKYASAYYYRRVIANYPDTAMARDAKKELYTRMPDKVNPPPIFRPQPPATQPASGAATQPAAPAGPPAP